MPFDPNAPGIGGDYGGAAKVDMNTVNQWMRTQPWYQQKLQSWGFGPGVPVKLNDSQKKELVHVAQSMGVKVDEGDTEIDDSGNFRAQGHKLRNTLIVAGIAAASLATMGAAGVFAGAGGVGAGAGAGAGGAAASGVGATAGMASALPGAVGAIPGLAGAAGTAGTLGGVASLAGKIGTLGKLGSTLGALGKGIGDATTAAGNNDLAAADQDVRVNNSNTSGISAFEQELMNRKKAENSERLGGLQDIYRASMAQNPTSSPYNTQGPQKQSPQYLKALADLAAQGSGKLAAGPQYNTNNMAALAPYKPINPAKPGSSTLQQIGNWVSPALSTAGTIASFF